MNKGFTLIETLVSLSLLLLAVLFSARVTIFVLGQTRNALVRFRLIETLEFCKNHLTSLPLTAPELEAGDHRQEGREFKVNWRVKAAGAFLKRIELLAATPGYSLPMFFYKSKFIQEVQHD